MKRVCFLLSLAVLAMTFLLLSLPAQAASSVYAHATVTDPPQGQSYKIPGMDPYPYYTGYVSVYLSSDQEVGINGGDPNTDYHFNFDMEMNWHYQSSGTRVVDSDGGTKTVRCDASGHYSYFAWMHGDGVFTTAGAYTANAADGITNTVSNESAIGANSRDFIVTN